MKKLTVLILLALSLSLPALAHSCLFSWSAVVTNTDSSPITNLAGYKLYFQPWKGDTTLMASILAPNVTYSTTDLCRVGTYKLSAYNTAGIESAKAILTVKTPSKTATFQSSP